MKTAIVCRNTNVEDPGSLEPLLVTRGYAVSYLDATIHDLYAGDTGSTDLLSARGECAFWRDRIDIGHTGAAR